MNYGLPLSVVEEIKSVFGRYPQIERATLYGSRAKGSYKNGSDIDLTLHGRADLTLNVVFSLLNDLDDLLLPYTFDLSIFQDIDNPDLLAHIRRVGVTLYQKDETIAELP